MTADLHWTVGFLEGEAWFGSSTTGLGYRRLTVECSQVNKEPLLRLQALWGGTINLRKVNTKPIWKWRVRTNVAKHVMAEVYPFLSVKRQEQINKARKEAEND